MPLQKKTLRNMTPVTRDLAKLVNEAQSVQRRLKNMLSKVASVEMDSLALHRRDESMAIVGKLKKVVIKVDGRSMSLDELFMKLPLLHLHCIGTAILERALKENLLVEENLFAEEVKTIDPNN